MKNKHFIMFVTIVIVDIVLSIMLMFQHVENQKLEKQHEQDMEIIKPCLREAVKR